MSDPWIVTPAERGKHEEQFKTLKPINGFITGEQAKGFFLQSRLPPQILGVIWMLADMDGDGKMNLTEFSIACKLINMKLRGFNLPQVLPPNLKQSALRAEETSAPDAAQLVAAPTMSSSIPAAMPTSMPASIPPAMPASMPPAMPASMPPAMPASIPPAMPNVMHPTIPGTGQPSIPGSVPLSMPPGIGSAMQPPLLQSVPAAVPQNITGSLPSSGPTASVVPLIPSASLMGSSAPPPVASVGPMAPAAPVASVAPIMATSVSLQQNSLQSGSVPAVAPLISGVSSTPLIASAVAPQPQVPQSSESSVIPQPLVSAPKPIAQDSNSEWGVPQASKLKFTQVFNMSDRAKTGFLSGAQARNILIQSALPQDKLAQIWALSDVDNDGKLSCEEFVLAMYLCEQAKAGKGVPPTLPPELIPPTLRRSRTSSIHSLSSIGTGTPGEAVLSPTSAQLASDYKRRENYEKGQAELERRRKALLDAQRRETEERLRREREEEMKREKARQEAERKRQEELEREMQRQREIEAQKEAERKRLEETKEQARKEAERQRQEEWEKQRLLELMNVRQRQQENLLSLKAKNQSLGIDLSTKEEKIKELTQKISETRIGVTEVKATIDNMRSTRDNYMADMNALKGQAREQNQRLLNLNQEKARLKARSLASAATSGAETAAVEASVTSKQMVIKQLQEKIEELEKELNSKEEDVNNNNTEFETCKEQLNMTGDRCKELYEEFNIKRKQVMALREKLLNPDAAWGDTGGSAWSEPEATTTSSVGLSRKFRALYQFDERSDDELSLLPGDIVTVVPADNAEPGWLSGTLNGKTGWFPEAYCEPYEEIQPAVVENETTNETAFADVNADVQTAPKPISEVTAIYDWRASRNNQLSFCKGNTINILGKLEDWLYGDLNGMGGWFPGNYVKGTISPVTSPLAAPEAPAIPQYLDHDEITQHYVAVYPYQSDEPGDLLFETGENLLVLAKEGDWWFGIIGERSGIFPSNYVQLSPSQLLSPKKLPSMEATIDEPKKQELQKADSIQSKVIEEEQQQQQQPVQSESEEIMKEETSEEKIEDREEDKAKVISVVSPPDSAKLKVNQDDNDAENKEVAELMQKSPRSPKTKGKKQEVAQVIAPYDATSNNQLSLVRGQMVSIRKKTASGWWEGELHAKGKKRQVGWFPASYVKVLVGSSRTTPVSMEMTGRDEYPPPDLTPGGFASAYSKNVMKGDAKIIAPPPQDPETVEALYPYTAMNDDELSFEPGDLIFVLDKEDSAWWKGSLRGVIGVFPSNYVQPKSEAKIASQPATVNIGSPDAEDSLCYSPKIGYQEWVGNVTPSQQKRFTAHECFNSPKEDMRQNVIREIIQTETSYLEDLLLVQKAFIKPMKNSGVVTKQDVELIFINWDELVLVSSSFDKALKVRWKNSDKGKIHMIADVLCQQISQLRPYMRFCSLQSRGSAIFNKKFEENNSWADVIRQCQEQPKVAGHTLTSFLLKPLQRLTKYPLLIKKLLSFTPIEHPDYQNTVDALELATTLCEQVNESVREQDNTDKLEWMQSHIQCDNLMERLVFNSLTNNLGPRKLLHMGILHKTKSKREILAFLLSDFLLLTTSNKSVGSMSLMSFERLPHDTICTMYRKPMFLSEIQVKLEKDSETSFLVTSQGIDISLAASSSNERNNWLKRITLAQKHIKDTERSQFNRNQSKEKDKSVVGRVLLSIMGGVELDTPEDVRGRSPKGFLKITQLRASLENLSKGNSQSFCEVSLGSHVTRTKIGTSSHPKWDHPMQFLVKSLSEDVLCITVYEKGFFKPNEFLGRAEVRIQNIYKKWGATPDPKVMRIPLQEVERGEVIFKCSLQIFEQQ